MFLSILGAWQGAAQVMWTMDFDTPLGWPNEIDNGRGGSSAPPISDLHSANPYGSTSNFMMLYVDFSPCTYFGQATMVLAGFNKEFTGYYPGRTFLVFDAWVSDLKPIQVLIAFIPPRPTPDRILEAFVSPTALGSFQHYKIPLSSFTLRSIPTNGTPDYPTGVTFALNYDQSRPDVSWGRDGQKFLYLDNLSYYVEPPSLNLSVTGSTAQLSWPTNAPGFALQVSPSAVGGTWSDMAASPVIEAQSFKVSIAVSADSAFYRLKSTY